MIMTIGELADLLNQAVNNGWKDNPIFVREFGKSTDTRKTVNMFDLVSGNREYPFAEIIYKR